MYPVKCHTPHLDYEAMGDLECIIMLMQTHILTVPFTHYIIFLGYLQI